jgi:hypothetical protein
MQIEAIGAIAVILGLVGWFAGQRFAVPVFVASTLLAASAALILSALGGANIQPAHLLLGFQTLSAMMSRASLRRAGAALLPPNAGFWLLLTAVYAMLSAVFLPRIFAGATHVFAIARTEIGPGIISMPLAPTSGNITQAVYFVGDVICFLVFYDAASRPDGVKTVTNAVIASAAINLGFCRYRHRLVLGWAERYLGHRSQRQLPHARRRDRARLQAHRRLFSGSLDLCLFHGGLLRLLHKAVDRRHPAPLDRGSCGAVLAGARFCDVEHRLCGDERISRAAFRQQLGAGAVPPRPQIDFRPRDRSTRAGRRRCHCAAS